MEMYMDFSQTAATLFRDLNGLQQMIKRLAFEVRACLFAVKCDPQMRPPHMRPQLSCGPRRGSCLDARPTVTHPTPPRPRSLHLTPPRWA